MHVNLSRKTTNIISRVNKINGWQNRAVYGATALMSQPFFDYKNPSVDKKTQKYSLIKTLIKIGVGATVGISSRAVFQKWGENLAKKRVFKPQNIKNVNPKQFGKCVGNVFSIIGAVAAMLSVDILISNKLLSHFNKKIQKKSGE